MMDSLEQVNSPPAVLAIDYRRPPSDFKFKIEEIALQLSHWFGTIAMLAMLGTWALVYKRSDFHWPVAISFAASDVGLCTAWLSGILARRGRRRAGEAAGVLIFNLIFLLLSLHLMFLDRLPAIRAWAEQFFTPS